MAITTKRLYWHSSQVLNPQLDPPPGPRQPSDFGRASCCAGKGQSQQRPGRSPLPCSCQSGPCRDPRRGRGSYELVLSNFKRELQRIKSPSSAELVQIPDPCILCLRTGDENPAPNILTYVEIFKYHSYQLMFDALNDRRSSIKILAYLRIIFVIH
jgi:hypothetical protein